MTSLQGNLTDADVEFPALGSEDARQVTDQIRVGLEATWQLIIRAYRGRAWVSLGYASWDDYCTREFGTSRLRLPREERPEVVASLREAGMSLRAIGAATGIDQRTVSRTLDELSTAANAAVDTEMIVGVDGAVRSGHPPTRREIFVRQSEAVALRAGGATQVEIASRLGVTQGTVSVDLATMDNLASRNGVDLGDLVDGSKHLDPRELAERLGVMTKAKTDLRKIARTVVRELHSSAAVLLTDVVEADGWIDADVQAGALEELVPWVADAALLLARIAEQIDSEQILDAAARQRWTQTWADASRLIGRIR